MKLPGSSRRAVLLLLLALASACDDPRPSTPPAEQSTVVERIAIEDARDGASGTLRGGESRRFRLSATAGEYLELDVVQDGIDLVAVLRGPGGDVLLEVDGPSGPRGAERLVWVAEESGEHRLELRASVGQAEGRFRLELRARRAAGELERRHADAVRRFTRGEELFWNGQLADAATELEAALETWTALRSEGGAELFRLDLWHAEALDRLGRTASRQGDWRASADHHRRAIDLFAELGDGRREAVNRDFLGRNLLKLGEFQAARDAFERAFALWDAADDEHGRGLAWGDLGRVAQRLGENQVALESYERALDVWRRLGKRESEAATLHNLGLLSRRLGRDARALDHLLAAEAIQRELGDTRGRAASLDLLGRLADERGDLPAARRDLELALALHDQLGDRRGRAVTLSTLARVVRQAGEAKRAIALHQQARDLFAELGDRFNEGQAWLNLASLEVDANRADVALDAGLRALEIFRALGEPHGRAEAHYQIAKARRLGGALREAADDLATTLEIFEELRKSTISPTLRADYFATLQRRYDVDVDLLLELAEAHPEERRRRLDEALEVHERRRARTLLEALAVPAERGAADRGAAGDDPRERELVVELRAVDRERAAADPAQRAELELRLRELTDALVEHRARRDASRPAASALAAEPLDPARIRERVLDESTLLVVYGLGVERGVLWVVDREGTRAVRLAEVEALERAAEAAYLALTRSHRREGAATTRRDLCALSHLLLAPLAELDGIDRPGIERLAIVADGVLERIPFGALPLPSGDGACRDEPLLARREIVHLPSASMVAALRAREAGRAAAPNALLVVADPLTDPRFGRLPYTAREADAILDAARERGVRADVARGADASREHFLAARPGTYRRLHFAVHGSLDPEHPELSALVLGARAADAAPLGGLLYAHEIQALDLAAELVVLSACRTALGREIRGEGLMGLTRSFLRAGATRVVVSLWQVDDAATADLMARFYRHLLPDGRPAAALRAAQLELAAEPRRTAPYFWAAFVLQGDWRPPPSPQPSNPRHQETAR